MGKYFKSGLYPQNFVLLGPSEQLYKEANHIVKEAFKLFPNQFHGKRQAFPFQLRYAPPFDKSFCELKRLQGTAAEEAGFSDVFRGYILMDISAYLKHESEYYFEVSMKYLHDMADVWKYIFLVDSTNEKASMVLVSKVLDILDDIPCGVIEQSELNMQPEANFIGNTCKKYGITCSSSVKAFLEELLIQKEYSEKVVSALIRELASDYVVGTIAGMEEIHSYFRRGIPVVKYMLSPKMYEELIALADERIEEAEYEQTV